jgi:hypothetical protein
MGQYKTSVKAARADYAFLTSVLFILPHPLGWGLDDWFVSGFSPILLGAKAHKILFIPTPALKSGATEAKKH